MPALATRTKITRWQFFPIVIMSSFLFVLFFFLFWACILPYNIRRFLCMRSLNAFYLTHAASGWSLSTMRKFSSNTIAAIRYMKSVLDYRDTMFPKQVGPNWHDNFLCSEAIVAHTIEIARFILNLSFIALANARLRQFRWNGAIAFTLPCRLQKSHTLLPHTYASARCFLFLCGCTEFYRLNTMTFHSGFVHIN